VLLSTYISDHNPLKMFDLKVLFPLGVYLHVRYLLQNSCIINEHAGIENKVSTLSSLVSHSIKTT